MITSTITGRKITRYRGLAIVETAIVISLLLVFTLAIVGFGLLFLRAQEITTAARHGARIAVTYGATEGQVTASIDSYLNTWQVNHSTTLSSIDPGVGEPVTVIVKGSELDPMNLHDLFIPGWWGKGMFPNTFTATVIMAKEGPDY
jgi:Flp pilus assembly protein TadG